MRLPPAAVRKVARPFIGEAVDFAKVSAPAQGVNNETYVVRLNGRGLVVKLRPRPGRNAKTSAQWPLYTRRLFGEVSNGAVSILEDVSTLLERHGAPRVRVEDFDTVRRAYERHAPWPRTYGDVRGAYMLATWMEWAYCLHTIVHDDGRARGLEEQLVWLARGFRDDALRRGNRRPSHEARAPVRAARAST